MPREPGSPEDAAALRALVRQLLFLTPIANRGPLLRLVFKVANTKRDVGHGLAAIPDGFFQVFADALIMATPGVAWTPTTAYLQSSTPNAHVVGYFYKLREEPIDA